MDNLPWVIRCIIYLQYFAIAIPLLVAIPLAYMKHDIQRINQALALAALASVVMFTSLGLISLSYIHRDTIRRGFRRLTRLVLNLPSRFVADLPADHGEQLWAHIADRDRVLAVGIFNAWNNGENFLNGIIPGVHIPDEEPAAQHVHVPMNEDDRRLREILEALRMNRGRRD